MNQVPQKELKNLLEYDKEIGRFKRLTARGGYKIGDIAGTLNADGYRHVRFAGRIFKEHSLVWLYIYGKYPEEIDHIDGDKSNKKVDNLRLCSKSENAMNRGKRSDNKSGFRGVTLNKQSQR